ncbi:TOG array regulator of axonemal microtubules protein 1-like isoform X4 [Syngnathus acus]|uniref:TOG array regulator of axonemal microtubules protein 1-like isoform X4 n=1 Tax=Syngnathus acus TaxID=161584 RepID=UPI001885C33D|nr:TOG array regulator of axonemal microtubules protein 1-like isoform X4 [Syngnathus acus]
MIRGIISKELYQQLLDPKNYQNRTNGVEELKRVLSDVDLKSVPSDSIEEFINFLPRLLDDSNFKVLYGTLQVLNIFIERLDTSIHKYIKQIALVAVKALGDTRTIARNEYINMFRLMMKHVAPQQVLDLVICNLKHKNSRVREDVLNIIIAAMLTHPRKEFNIPKLCFEVAPSLADSKRNVRHAALELFAVFDSCLETGKKQPLTKAVDNVELKQNAEGLMAAVQARRARHVLPKLSPEGVVEYGLLVPKSGLHCATQASCSGDDLDWVMTGGRISSARSHRTEPDYERPYGYGSLGSLTDELPSQRRIVSAGKGKNKLPWEMLDYSLAENNHQCHSPNGKCSEQVTIEEVIPLSRKLSPETYISTFSSAEPQTPQTSKRIFPARLRRSGSLNLDPDVFKTTNFTESDSALSKGHMLSRNGSVERTLSLPSNHTIPGSFLLPSYPLAALPGSVLTPTLSHRHVDTSLSMSNTWPNKRENSPHQREPSFGGDAAVKGDFPSRCSPRPIRASLKSSSSTSSSTSSFRRVLSSSRTSLSISPVIPSGEQFYNNDPRPGARSSPQNQGLERDLQLEPMGSNTTHDTEEEEPLDVQEMLNSLRSLRNSAAKKRAKVSLSSSDTDQDSQDSAIRSPLSQEVHTSSMLTSSTSESGLSSLSPTTSSVFGIKSSGSMASPGVNPRRVPSANLRSSVSMDFSNPPGPRSNERRNLPATDMPEGVIGRVSSPRSDLALSLEQGDSVAKPTADPLGAFPVISGDHRGRDDFYPDERFIRDKIQPQHLDQLEGQSSQRDKIRHRVRQMLSDSPNEKNINNKDPHMNGSAITSCVEDLPLDGSPLSLTSSVSPLGPQSPVKCLTPPHQPSPPTVPPKPNKLSRMRRAHSLSRTRPSLSHSSDELSPVTMDHKKYVSPSPKLRPFSKPDLALMQSFDLLSSTKWEKKLEGLTVLRTLARYHADTLQGRLRDVCLFLIEEVNNLRSVVSRTAVYTLGDFYMHLQKAMDQDLDETVKALLPKVGVSKAFMRDAVDGALDNMVRHCTPTRGIHALLSGGLSHLNPLVRKCTAQHLADLVEQVGATRLLSGSKDLTERILPAVTKLSQDSSQEARYHGRRMLLSLSCHPDFEKILERTIPSKDLQPIMDTIFTLKTKGLGKIPQDSQSARGRRSLRGSGTVRALSLTREPLYHNVRLSNSNYGNRSQTRSITDKNEYLKYITALLGSKDFRERIKGMDQLVADCQHNRNVVIHNLFPVFDALKDRLQEANSKVNQYALESLQKIIPLMKDNLSQVVNILVPAIVDNHLNSKNNAIYSAAIGTIDALILNLDNSLLLQPFCTKAQFASGKAKVDLVEKVEDLVSELYPRKPQMVEQKVLPLLWHLLSTSGHSGTVHGRGGSVRAATANLCQALHTLMGPSLNECAASQSANVHKGLNEFLKQASKR